MRIGFVGWRGMVGSVLLQRMLEEHDFDLLDVEFFSVGTTGMPLEMSREFRLDTFSRNTNP